MPSSVGVCGKRNGFFQARIVVDGTQRRLGDWPTQRQAAAAYDSAARFYRGEGAGRNGTGAPPRSQEELQRLTSQAQATRLSTVASSTTQIAQDGPRRSASAAGPIFWGAFRRRSKQHGPWTWRSGSTPQTRPSTPAWNGKPATQTVGFGRKRPRFRRGSGGIGRVEGALKWRTRTARTLIPSRKHRPSSRPISPGTLTDWTEVVMEKHASHFQANSQGTLPKLKPDLLHDRIALGPTIEGTPIEPYPERAEVGLSWPLLHLS